MQREQLSEFDAAGCAWPRAAAAAAKRRLLHCRRSQRLVCHHGEVNFWTAAPLAGEMKLPCSPCRRG
eukprot:2736439-Alexandrium_andersonii.AAC.1